MIWIIDRPPEFAYTVASFAWFSVYIHNHFLVRTFILLFGRERRHILQSEGHVSLVKGVQVSNRQRVIVQVSVLALLILVVASLGITARADAPLVRPVGAYTQGTEELAWLCPDACPSDRALTEAELKDLCADVIVLTNQQRANYGLPPLAANAALAAAATAHSNDMANKNFFSHTGSDGSNPGQRISRAGYNWYTYGENIAAGYT